jgi:hypothetical protein
LPPETGRESKIQRHERKGRQTGATDLYDVCKLVISRTTNRAATRSVCLYDDDLFAEAFKASSLLRDRALIALGYEVYKTQREEVMICLRELAKNVMNKPGDEPARQNLHEMSKLVIGRAARWATITGVPLFEDELFAQAVEATRLLYDEAMFAVACQAYGKAVKVHHLGFKPLGMALLRYNFQELLPRYVNSTLLLLLHSLLTRVLVWRLSYARYLHFPNE